jgi:hypothetical protein
MGIGAKIATVLAAGIVATGVGRETVEAVQANDSASAPTKPAAVVDSLALSPVALLTSDRAGGDPLAQRTTRRRAGADRRANRFSGASKSLRGIAAGRSQQGSPTAGGNQPGSSNAPSLPGIPPAPQAPVQLPQTPAPTVQVPTVQVPTVQVPTVTVPTVTVPTIPLPPPPPLIP